MRLLCPKDPLCENQIDDIDDEDSEIYENLGRDGEACVVLSGCPCYPQNESCHSSHAETGEKDGEDELVVFSAISSKYGGIRYSEAKVEGYKDGADGNVCSYRWEAAETSSFGRIWAFSGMNSL